MRALKSRVVEEMCRVYAIVFASKPECFDTDKVLSRKTGLSVEEVARAVTELHRRELVALRVDEVRGKLRRSLHVHRSAARSTEEPRGPFGNTRPSCKLCPHVDMLQVMNRTRHW